MTSLNLQLYRVRREKKEERKQQTNKNTAKYVFKKITGVRSKTFLSLILTLVIFLNLIPIIMIIGMILR